MITLSFGKIDKYACIMGEKTLPHGQKRVAQ